MAIPVVTGDGYSRAVSIRVASRIQVPPPQIFVERTTLLEGEHISLKWKPSPYFQRVQVQVASDPNFSNVLKTVKCSNPQGSLVGLFPNGSYYLRTSWETSSMVMPQKEGT